MAATEVAAVVAVSFIPSYAGDRGCLPRLPASLKRGDRIKRATTLLSGTVLILLLLITACQVDTRSTTTTTPTPLAATLLPLSVDVEGLEISSQGNVIEVSLAGLTKAVADQVQSLPNVTKVEGYLKVATPDYPGPLVGVEPGPALRVGDTIVRLAVGEGFQSKDERTAIPGFNLNSNPYTGGDGMAAMVHTFSPGQSFSIKGSRLRVVGLFRASDENAILLPLGTAQEIFGMEGKLTNIFVTVDSQKNVDQVTAEIRKILGGDGR